MMLFLYEDVPMMINCAHVFLLDLLSGQACICAQVFMRLCLVVF